VHTTPVSARRPHRVSLAESIARTLEAEVMDGTLERGARVGTKQGLRERFGVALATVGEAVKLLETRGILVTRPGPGGGVFVADASAQLRVNQFLMGYRWSEAEVVQHHTVRNALEPLICRHAACRRTAADVRELRGQVEAMHGVEDDALPYLRLTWALHRRIARLCPNAPLQDVYLTMLEFLEESTARADIAPFNARRHYVIHRELVEAKATGPGDRLEHAIAAHEVQPARTVAADA
jgi:DNA-binding FadR family transcriptional regulator